MVIYNAISAFADWAWGVPMLIWLVGGGIILWIATGFVQTRRLGYCLKHTIVSRLKEKKKSESISGLQAVLSALSGTIGTGNIVGVSTAIAMGGSGAVFWMWVVGIVAMGIKYCEALASVKYREPAENAAGYLWNAGPSMYLKKGVPFPKLGKVLATVYAFTVTWGLLLSGPEHTSAITDVATAAFGMDKVPVLHRRSAGAPPEVCIQETLARTFNPSCMARLTWNTLCSRNEGRFRGFRGYYRGLHVYGAGDPLHRHLGA